MQSEPLRKRPSPDASDDGIEMDDSVDAPRQHDPQMGDTELRALLQGIMAQQTGNSDRIDRMEQSSQQVGLQFAALDAKVSEKVRNQDDKQKPQADGEESDGYDFQAKSQPAS